MSFSDRLQHAVIRGCLIAALFLLSGESGAQPNDTSSTKQQTHEPSGAPTGTPLTPEKSQAGPVAEQKETERAAYDPHCDKPKDREDSDLCEQRRMSRAAEESAWWTAFQSKLGIAGFAAVLLSLFFTGWAARAAAAAAKSAQQSIKVASQTAERQLRPWLTVQVDLDSDIALEQGANNFGLRIYARITIRNVGNSAARNVSVHAEANNIAGLDIEKFTSECFDHEIERARQASDSGELLAPTETHIVTFGTMVLEADLSRLLPIQGRRFVAPYVAVIVTYGAVGGTDEVLYTGKAFILLQRGEGSLPMSIDLDRLPIARADAGLSSYPKHARAN